jgi:hypothetical protein
MDGKRLLLIPDGTLASYHVFGRLPLMRNPFSNHEDPVEHMIELLSKEAEHAGDASWNRYRNPHVLLSLSENPFQLTMLATAAVGQAP